MNRVTTLLALLTALAVTTAAGAADVDWTKVDQAIGRKGSDQPGGVHKYSFPRSDLSVTVDGVPIKPALALGGWIAFQPSGSAAMFMGDLVLTDTEIRPVMTRLIAGDVEIRPLGNCYWHQFPADRG